jgi:hypothetical protein
MVTVEKTNLMASTWTKAVLVRRAFNAGPKRKSDRVLDAEEATLEAYMAFRAFRNEAAKSGLGSAARLGLMLMDTKCKGRDEIMGVPTKLENIAELFAKVKKATKGGEVVPLGLLYWLRDDDPEAVKTPKGANWDGEEVEMLIPAVTWVKPWLVESPRARLVTEAARHAFEESGGDATRVRV